MRYSDGVTPVYPNGPALPVTVAYFDGFTIGTTKEAIYNQPLYSDSLQIIVVTDPATGRSIPIVLTF